MPERERGGPEPPLKRGPGRPVVEDYSVHKGPFRFTERDWELLGQLAERRGSTRAGVVRDLIRAAAEREGIQ